MDLQQCDLVFMEILKLMKDFCSDWSSSSQNEGKNVFSNSGEQEEFAKNLLSLVGDHFDLSNATEK